MQEKNELFRNILAQAGENYMKSGDPKSPESVMAGNKFNYLLLAILLFVGADALKLMFRTNFGSQSISLLRFGIAGLVFFLWGIICISMGLQGFDIEEVSFNGAFGGVIGLFITAVFYLALGFFTFSAGTAERTKSKSQPSSFNPYYSGDSVVFGFLFESGWSAERVQNVAEPLAAFAFGILLTAVNPMLGSPILFCSLSLVVNNLYDKFIGLQGYNKVRETLARSGYKEDDFSRVSRT